MSYKSEYHSNTASLVLERDGFISGEITSNDDYIPHLLPSDKEPVLNESRRGQNHNQKTSLSKELDDHPNSSISNDSHELHSPPYRKHNKGNVIMWSSCQDSERSYEVLARKDHRMKGAMTHAFIECLKDRKRQTYRELLDRLSETLILWGCPQRPMMSSTHHINMCDMVSL
ncbi:hypothetical protein K439DRAFT_1150970 [Ramaria rubella]|nr:hypothetical protein K439DRAFT_1150970 [Ramaria rubella]